MVLKFVTKEGTKVYGPPYTKQEEAEFYSRNANGPVTVARGADVRKARKCTATSVADKASARPELENSQDPKRTRTRTDIGRQATCRALALPLARITARSDGSQCKPSPPCQFQSFD
jgi:hypothetical protein